jgi:hypothetical protein
MGRCGGRTTAALADSGLVVHGSVAGLIRLLDQRADCERPETEQRHGGVETMGLRLGRDACMQLGNTIGLLFKVNWVVVVLCCVCFEGRGAFCSALPLSRLCCPVSSLLAGYALPSNSRPALQMRAGISCCCKFGRGH